MGFIENSIAFVFVLGVMVLIHELGHFLAARYFDVRVESFAIGMGPRLFGIRRGDTDYKICALPIGGYVKMAGDSIGEPTGDPGEFLAKPRWQRLIIAFAGPLFNVLLAIALPVGLYMTHFERYTFWSQPAVVGYVQQDSPAEKAGLRSGDRIVELDGADTPDWQSVRLAEVAAVNKTAAVVFERDGRRVEAELLIEPDEQGMGRAGWIEAAPVRLGAPVPGMPAAAADIEAGDLLAAIDGEPIDALTEVIELIQGSDGKPLRLTLERDGRQVETEVAAVYDDAGPQPPAWRIGIGLEPLYESTVTELGFVEALGQSVEDNRRNAMLIFKFLGGLIEQRMSPKSLEGPIGIARLSGEAARRGWPELIGLMAGISLNLGIFNLLPIPILDGGVILMLLFESVIRRDVSLAVKERIVQAGLVFLVLLFAFVMYNDILKSLPGG